jgi:hypothetical protein
MSNANWKSTVNAVRVPGDSKKITDFGGKNLSGDCPRNSLNAPSHTLGALKALRLAEFTNAHLRSTAACDLKDVAVRRGHFKDAVLITKGLRRVDDFNRAVNSLDHSASSQ